MSRQLPQQGQQDDAQRRATGRLRRMPITIDKRVKKKDGVSRYRVRVSVPDSHTEIPDKSNAWYGEKRKLCKWNNKLKPNTMENAPFVQK